MVEGYARLATKGAQSSYLRQGGSIRGFLNDGSTDYRHHHAVDSLAFGHCDYSYRNLGRPSTIQIKQEANNFQVSVDGKQCLTSDKVSADSRSAATLGTFRS